jgi:hypothetical protein
MTRDEMTGDEMTRDEMTGDEITRSPILQYIYTFKKIQHLTHRMRVYFLLRVDSMHMCMRVQNLYL